MFASSQASSEVPQHVGGLNFYTVILLRRLLFEVDEEQRYFLSMSPCCHSGLTRNLIRVILKAHPYIKKEKKSLTFAT